MSVSIALTTYNGQRFLREQLDSILSQTIDFKELIVCDDNSSDSTLDILQEFQGKDPRIKVHQNEKNLGFKKNFEKALRLCTGDFIALCDQDDIWTPDHLEILRNGIGDKMLCCGNASLMDADGASLNMTLTEVKNFRGSQSENQSIFKFITYYQNPFQGASMLMRKKFLEYAMPIPESVKYHDVWFSHIATLSDSFVFVDKPVNNYRMHLDNASGEHKHHTPLRALLGHLIKRNLDTNRREIIEAISLSEIPLSSKSKTILDEARAYHSYRNEGFTGRLRNFFYELKNFKEIYGRI